MISLRQIIKEMLGQRLRLWLTVLAIAWSTASITLMLAVGEGMRLNFGETMANTGHSLLVAMPDSTSKTYHGIMQGNSVQFFEKDLIDLRKSLVGASSILSEMAFQAPLKFGNDTTWANPTAVGPEYGAVRQISILSGGRFINNLDMENNRLVIVLGNRVAKSLFSVGEKSGGKRSRKKAFAFNESPLSMTQSLSIIGKPVTLGGKTFTVVGVAKEKMQLESYSPPDDYTVWIPQSTYRVLSGINTYSDFIIVPEDPSQNKKLEKQIRQIIARNHGYDANDEQIIDFWDSYSSQEKTNSFFLGMQFFLGIIGVITLIVAGVGIANVMYVSVKKATRDIGIRMAIGAKTYHILVHYIIEALMATLIGGIIGMVFSEIVVFGVGCISTSGQMASFIGNFKPVLSYNVIVIVMAILGFIGFLAALFPAMHAAKIDPSRALQHA